MKLSFTVIFLFGLFQLFPADNSQTLPIEKQPVKYYDKKFRSFAKEIYTKLKRICDKILKDGKVKQAANSLMKEFKSNITYFQEIYPAYVHLGLGEALLITFSNMVTDYYNPQLKNNQDAVYILQLLRNLGYDEIRNHYKTEFRKFISQNFLPEFQELESKITKKRQLTKFEINLLKWVNMLKECQEYECYLNTFRRFNLTPKDKFFGFMQRKMLDMTIFYQRDVTLFANAVLKDSRLNQLGNKFQEFLRLFLKMVIDSFQMKRELSQMDFVEPIDVLLLSILEDRFNEPLKELSLVTAILEDNGFSQAELNFVKRLKDLLNHDTLKALKLFKNSLNKQELENEKPLLEELSRYQDAKTLKERRKISANLRKLDNNEYAKWRI